MGHQTGAKGMTRVGADMDWSEQDIPLWYLLDSPMGEIMVISRVISEARYKRIRQDDHFFRAPALGIEVGAVFRLDKLPFMGRALPGAPDSLAVLFRRREESWLINGEPGPWSVNWMSNRRVEGLFSKIWISFLFDYLQLDPNAMSPKSRNLLKFPYSGKSAFREPRREWDEPWPVPAQDPRRVLEIKYTLAQSPEHLRLVTSIKELGVHLTGNIPVKEGGLDNLTFFSPFVQFQMVWDIDDSQRLVFWVPWPMSSGPQLTPMEAIQASGIFVTDDELDAWIDARCLEGVPIIPEADFEAYRLLGTDIPPLFMPPEDLIVYLKTKGYDPWRHS